MQLSNPMPHFRGCPSRRITRPCQYQGYHQPRNNMSPLQDTPDPKYHITWTLYLQKWTMQQTSDLLPSALGHNLLPWLMSSLDPRQTNCSTQTSLSKVWRCLSLTKPQDNYYSTTKSTSPQSLHTYGTHPTPMNLADYAKEL